MENKVQLHMQIFVVVIGVKFQMVTTVSISFQTKSIVYLSFHTLHDALFFSHFARVLFSTFVFRRWLYIRTMQV